MKHLIKQGMVMVMAVLVIMTLILAGCGGAAPAAPKAPAAPAQPAAPKETAADFYKGKSIDFYIMTTAGGGHDAISRIYAEGLAKYSGATVVPINKPGGGFMLAPIYVATTSKPDGLSISAVDDVSAEAGQVLGLEGMEKVDVTKWNWLCSMRAMAQILFVKADSPITSLGDIIKSDNVFKLNVPSLTSNNGIFGLMVMQTALGKKNFKVYAAVEGGAEQVAAVVRGEFDGASLPANRIDAYKGQIKPIMCLGIERDPTLPNVPTLAESLKATGMTLNDEQKFWVDVINGTTKSLTSVMTGPAVPQDRVDFLRTCLEKAGKDPDLLAKGDKAGLGMKWKPGQELAEAVNQFVKMSPERVAALKNAIKAAQSQ